MSDEKRSVSTTEALAGVAAIAMIAFPVASVIAAGAWRWRRDSHRVKIELVKPAAVTLCALVLAVCLWWDSYCEGWTALTRITAHAQTSHSFVAAILLMLPMSMPVGLVAGVVARDIYVWQRSRHPIHGRAIRARESERRRQGRATLANNGNVPLVEDEEPVIGVTLNSNSKQSNRFTVVPKGASHIVAIGASGAGKTQTILRLIAAHMQMGWRVIVIDAKEDNETGMVFSDLARTNGVARMRTKVWPNAGPVDLFRGDSSAVRDRLMACETFTEPYYKSVAGMILTLVSEAPQRPRCFADVVSSLDAAALKATWAGTPKAALASGIVASDVQGVRYRYSVLESQLHSMGAIGGNAGGWSWEDCDAAWITLPTSTRTEGAASFGRALLVDLVSYIRDPQRRQDKRPILLVVEEMGAIVSGDPTTARLVIEAFERARSAHVRAIVSVQTPDGLGEPDVQNRILGSGAAVLCHRMPMPEIICNLLGTRYGLEASLGVSRSGDLLDAGSLREQSQFVLPPDLVRQLPVGQAVFIHGHHWSHVAVPRAHAAST